MTGSKVTHTQTDIDYPNGTHETITITKPGSEEHENSSSSPSPDGEIHHSVQKQGLWGKIGAFLKIQPQKGKGELGIDWDIRK